MENNESEFGKGYSYCLGLFLAHAERYSCEKCNRKNIGVIGILNGDYGLWFHGAGDHLYEFDAKTGRAIDFRNKVLHLRCEKATKEDFEWAIREAKDLLMEYDKSNGIEVTKGNYE